MINAVSFKFSENIGRFLENLVFIELKRKNKELYYFSKKYECDFVIKQGLNIIDAIQVCYELTEENKKREISGLVEAMKEFKLKQGLILTYNDEDEIIIDNKKILIKPVWKWLLE
jgi:predicted AAA+ superfamily ATPase